MKSLKVVLTSLFLAASLIFTSSFLVKDFKKDAFATVCYSFDTSLWHRNLDNHAMDFVLQTQFTSPAWWTQTFPPPGGCIPTTYICAICFDSNQATLSQVLDALYWQIWGLGTPVHGASTNLLIGGSSVSVTVFLTFH